MRRSNAQTARQSQCISVRGGARHRNLEPQSRSLIYAALCSLRPTHHDRHVTHHHRRACEPRAQACGSPRVALDQRRVSPFSRAMRAITARVGPCAWAGLQAMVATSHFRQRLLRRAQSLTQLPRRWLRWRYLRVRARLEDINGCLTRWESFEPFIRVPDFVAPICCAAIRPIPL